MRLFLLPPFVLLHLQFVLAIGWTDRALRGDIRHAPVKAPGSHPFQGWSSFGGILRGNNNPAKILRRERRQFVIPSIKIPENDAGPFPKHFTTLRAMGKTKPVRFNVTGPGMEQTPDGYFSYNPNTGYLYTTRPIDRETTPRVQLEYFVFDEQGILLEGPKRLKIEIVDVNDNCPEFTSDSFNVTIPENSTYATSVLQVSAVDRDDASTPHGRVTHRIVSQSPVVPFPNLFAINETTGVISTAFGLFDRELVAGYTLTVEAADMEGRAGALSASATVSVTISDVNDNPPVCQHSQVYGEVKENATDVKVLTLSVTDRDERFTPNWRAVYKVQNGKAAAHIAIKTDPLTNQGIVSIVKPVHYRDTKVIVLNVSVENEVAIVGGDTGIWPAASGQRGTGPSGDTPQSGPGSRRLCQLVIRVAEEELAPMFVEPRVEVTLEEAARPGTRVAILTAIDPNYSASPIELAEPTVRRPYTVQENLDLTDILFSGLPVSPWVFASLHWLALADPNRATVTVNRYGILHDEANWLRVDKTTGEVTTRATLNKNSTFVQNGTYTAIVTAIKYGATTWNATCPVSLRLRSPVDRALLTQTPELARQRGLNAGAMAAVICSLVALVLAVVFLLLCRRSKKSQPSEHLISKVEPEDSVMNYNEDGGEEKPYSLRLLDMIEANGKEVSMKRQDREDPSRHTTGSSLSLQKLSSHIHGEMDGEDRTVEPNLEAQSFAAHSEDGSIFQIADLDVDLNSVGSESLPKSCLELATQPEAASSATLGRFLLRSKNFQDIHKASDVTAEDGNLAAQRFSKSMHSFSDARESEFASSELLLDQDLFAAEHSDRERDQSDEHGMSDSTDVSLDCDWPDDNGSESVTLETPQSVAKPTCREFERLSSGHLQECFSSLLHTEKELVDMDPLAQAKDVLLSYRYEGDGSRADSLSCCSGGNGNGSRRSAQLPMGEARR